MEDVLMKGLLTIGSLFECGVPEGAAPCTYDSRFDPDVADGTLRGKVRRKIKQGVKMGQSLPWIGVESRDQFVPVNDVAKKLNKHDREFLLAELKKLNIEVPADATLGELGKTFNRYDPRLAHCFAKYGIQKSVARTFKPKVDVPLKDDEGTETEKANLKLWLDDHKVPYHQMLGLKKLRQLKADALAGK